MKLQAERPLVRRWWLPKRPFQHYYRTNISQKQCRFVLPRNRRPAVIAAAWLVLASPVWTQHKHRFRSPAHQQWQQRQRNYQQPRPKRRKLHLQRQYNRKRAYRKASAPMPQCWITYSTRYRRATNTIIMTTSNLYEIANRRSYQRNLCMLHVHIRTLSVVHWKIKHARAMSYALAHEELYWYFVYLFENDNHDFLSRARDCCTNFPAMIEKKRIQPQPIKLYSIATYEYISHEKWLLYSF